MDDPLVVRESDDLCNLPQEFDPLFGSETLADLGHVMIEPNTLGEVLEDQGRAEFVLCEAVGAEDVRMLERFEQVKLAQCRPLDDLPIFRGCSGANEIHPNPTLDILQLDVGCLPVLEARSFEEKLAQHEIADFAGTLGRPNTSLIHRLADRLGCRPVNVALDRLLQAGAVAAFDGRHNAGTGWSFGGGIPISETNPARRRTG